MKKAALFLFIIITQSCFKKTDNVVKTDDQVLKATTNAIELVEVSDSVAKDLKSFYTSYISENAKNVVDRSFLKELKNKYVTQSFLNKLQKLELDYDPFVNAQDYNSEWIKNLGIIKDNSKENTYNVIITDNGVRTNILLVLKKEQNQYKIDDIANLPNNTIVADKIENYSQEEVTGIWKTVCQANKTALLANDSSHGYLDVYINNDYARVAVEIVNNTDVKYSVLTGITRYNKFVNWLYISNDSIVCKVKRTNENELELEWLGFYNKKTKKREMVKNPFNNEIKTNLVELRKCQ
ncbi:MAG: DUF3828 domain-containing protein [Flavobacterium sp.]|uniref:DUF3828 domain-containing protein n=1 Tax=Flavobacterium sp. TaxID=239 RepID=UPI00326674C1